MGDRYRWPYAISTALYCAAIFYLSSRPVPEIPQPLLFPGLDKVIHAVLFGGLAGLVCLGLWRSNRTINARLLFWAPLGFAVLYGLSDEVHQLFVPARTFDWLDLVADTVGAAAVQLILAGWILPGLSKNRVTNEGTVPPSSV